MHVLTTTSDADQTIYYIPSTSVTGAVYYTITNKNTNTSTNGTATATAGVYTDFLVDTFTLTEDTYYFFQVYSDSGRTTKIYENVIFCTDQDAEDYSTTDGNFTPRNTDNEFIVR
jgi:hypothetical protein